LEGVVRAKGNVSQLKLTDGIIVILQVRRILRQELPQVSTSANYLPGSINIPLTSFSTPFLV